MRRFNSVLSFVLVLALLTSVMCGCLIDPEENTEGSSSIPTDQNTGTGTQENDKETENSPSDTTTASAPEEDEPEVDDATIIMNNFNTLYDRYYDLQWGKVNNKTVAKYEAQVVVDETGSYFSTVNYDSNRAASWETAKHLSNLVSFISAYGEERLKTDTEARERVMALLDYWLDNDFYCNVNWYPNEITTPRNLAKIGLMLKPYLSEEQIIKMDEIISRGTLRGENRVETYTGANLLDCMSNTIIHGLFIEEPNLIFAAVERVESELRIVSRTEEGMQEDGSFFQHGALLCAAGSYGSVFIKGVSDILANLHGTIFSISDEKTELFIDHLLEGQRYFHRMYGTSYFSIGRSAVYANGASSLYESAAKLANLDGIYRSADLEKYVESFEDNSKALTDYKYFPLSYSLVNTAPEHYFAVRGAHKGFILTEVVNLQNTLGYNLSYGANTCYMYYGDEYQDIGAVMDLSMFPGTTAYLETEEELLARYERGYKVTWGKETYTGTHCDGIVDKDKKLGALYMELINDGLTGKLSFITYDGGMIALGAGLDCSKVSNTAEIRTILDQSKYNSATASGTALSVNGGTTTVNDGSAITNGAFAYYNLGEGELTAEVKSMTNSYKRNNPAGSTTEVTKDVFQLYISHGTAMTDASYAYAVVANSDGSAPDNASALPIKSITNTTQVQAIEFEDGSAVIVFHEAGSHTLSSGHTVTSTAADIIIR